MKTLLLKFLSLFAAFIICSPCAFSENPWGHLGDVKKAEQEEYRQAQNNERGEVHKRTPNPFLLGKIIKNETIKYCIYDKMRDMTPARAKVVAGYIETALNGWVNRTAWFIENSKNKYQFEDILPILQKKVRTERVACPVKLNMESKGNDIMEEGIEVIEGYEEKPVDLLVLLSDDICKNGTLGGFRMSKYSSSSFRKDLIGSFICTHEGFSVSDVTFAPYYIILHELGHALGLSDQYKVGNTDFYYGSRSKKTEDSIMASTYINHINCDDADGFITLIDRKMKIKRGGDKGWASLCKDGRVYIETDTKMGVQGADIGFYDSKEKVMKAGGIPGVAVIYNADNGQIEQLFTEKNTFWFSYYGPDVLVLVYEDTNDYTLDLTQKIYSFENSSKNSVELAAIEIRDTDTSEKIYVSIKGKVLEFVINSFRYSYDPKQKRITRIITQDDEELRPTVIQNAVQQALNSKLNIDPHTFASMPSPAHNSNPAKKMSKKEEMEMQQQKMSAQLKQGTRFAKLEEQGMQAINNSLKKTTYKNIEGLVRIINQYRTLDKLIAANAQPGAEAQIAELIQKGKDMAALPAAKKVAKNK
ncbi:MAG: hypothetical protein LBL61_05060 [Elusimicrobiota bacterium]|jgi:hypothetical protein|nr:hypothetical protein [Elusimicrobiota bacterium]